MLLTMLINYIFIFSIYFYLTEMQSLDGELMMINLLPAHLGCLDDLIYDFVSDCSTHAVSRFD